MSQAAQLGDWGTRPMLALRPRRWYTTEIAPHSRDVRLTARLWRYRALVRRTRNDAAPASGAASVCIP